MKRKLRKPNLIAQLWHKFLFRMEYKLLQDTQEYELSQCMEVAPDGLIFKDKDGKWKTLGFMEDRARTIATGEQHYYALTKPEKWRPS